MIERRSYSILILGAGPAGLAAAVAARESGQLVGVVDDNPDLGGQIWRGEHAAKSVPEAARWIDRVEASGADLLSGTQVVGHKTENALQTEQEGRLIELSYERLILATGARELFLPFPGWTLPNVMGAGGLQALVKSGLPIEGRTVVVAGSGPLLLAVAATLKKKGATIACVAEQAPFSRVAPFGLGLWKDPKKLLQAIGLKRELAGVRLDYGAWPVRAAGKDRLESVTLTDGERSWTIRCDYLACGFGLVPNVELAAVLGCAIVGGKVSVDALQLTTRPNTYAVGESVGIGGLETALVEGMIAGYAASGQASRALPLLRRRDAARRFARELTHAFTLRPELKRLADDETIICRCEDVSLGKIKSQEDILAAKLQTRCGMGPCQGRICGPALEFVLGWTRGSVRPPILPAELHTLAGLSREPDGSLS